MKTRYKLLLVTFFVILLFVSITNASKKLLPVSEQLEQQRKEGIFMLSSLLLFLSVSGIIILGNWIRHIKEKKSSDYLIHGILGFLIGIMHIFISFFSSLIIFLFLLFILESYAPFLAYGLFTLLLTGGCILEFVSYKKTKKLFWVYALIFSILLTTYIIVLHVCPYHISGFRGLFY